MSIQKIHPQYIDITGSSNGQVLFSNGSVTGWRSSALLPSSVYSIASSTTVTINPSLYNEYVYTALATTLTITSSTVGSPTNGTKVLFRFKDNGNQQTLTWTTDGSSGSFRVIGTTLPSSTTAINGTSKVTYVGCVYNSDDQVWDVIAVSTQL
jgi:hypothetical protein